MAIDWGGGGYSADEWRVYRVDPATWADSEIVGGFVTASVECDVGSSMPTMERGSFEVDTPLLSQLGEGYYRLCMVASQGNATERVDVATLWCSRSGTTVDKGLSTTEVTGESVLYPASRAQLTTGSYAPAGVDGPTWVASMLSEVIEAPVTIADGARFTLDEHVVMDAGTSVLDAAWLVLNAGRHVLTLSGRGEVTVAPMPTGISLTLDTARARLLVPGVQGELDWSDVPNRYVAVDGAQVAEAVNDDPDSPTSTVSRGWRADELDTSPIRVDGETLAAYCARRLEELSIVSERRTYSREWWPGVGPYSVVRGSMPSVMLDGDMRVEKQRLTCGNGILVEECACREVMLWQRS